MKGKIERAGGRKDLICMRRIQGEEVLNSSQTLDDAQFETENDYFPTQNTAVSLDCHRPSLHAPPPHQPVLTFAVAIFWICCLNENEK